MRNASRFLAVVGVAVALVAAASPASAACAAPTSVASFTGDLANYVYFDLGPGTTAAQLKGTLYDADTPLTDNTGTYGANEWMFVDVSGKFSVTAELANNRVIGCPSGKLVLRAQASTPGGVRFVTAVANQGQSNPTGAQFDFSFGKAPGTVIPSAIMPRPRVLSSAGPRPGPVTMQVSLDAANGGNTSGDSSSAIVSYDIVKATGGTDPGRDAANWTLVQNVPAPGGSGVPSVPLTADCTNASVDQWFATRAVFPGGSKSELVSDPTRVNCNPALAEPRFNVVPKKPVGPKKGAQQ